MKPPSAPAPELEADADTDDERPAPRRRPAQDETDDDTPAPKAGARPSSHAAAGVLGGLGGLVVLAIFILVVSGKWVDLVWQPLQRFLEGQGIHPLFAAGITAVLLLIPVTLYSAAHTKSVFLNNIPGELDFRPARLPDYPHLDADKLQSYTEAFEALGFRRLTDYTVVTDVESDNKGFARLFVHPESHCFAEVNQVCTPSGPAAPMHCNLVSYLENGWSASTGDRPPTKYSYVMRRPRAVWQSLVRERVEGLVTAHLKCRSGMVRDLGVAVLTEDTAESYFERERESTDQRKEAVRGRNGLLILLEMWLFEKNLKREWLGEYARKASKSPGTARRQARG